MPDSQLYFLSNNDMIGTLPKALGALAELQGILLDNNQIYRGRSDPLQQTSRSSSGCILKTTPLKASLMMTSWQVKQN
jgi:hypothetical protein